MERTRKVLAYVTHGRRLLLFTHAKQPSAGIQVPAGTLLPGEAPEYGVLREAWEETGLESLALGAYLGRRDRPADGETGAAKPFRNATSFISCVRTSRRSRGDMSSAIHRMAVRPSPSTSSGRPFLVASRRWPAITMRCCPGCSRS